MHINIYCYVHLKKKKKDKEEDPESYGLRLHTSVPGKVTEQDLMEGISRHTDRKMIRNKQH